VPIDDAAAVEISQRSRGTPRIANRFLKRVRDYAQVRASGHITLEVARAGLKMLEVDEHGFDEVDRRLLRTIIDKFGGGPVGLNTIAAAISEEKDAIEDIYEPFLIQIRIPGSHAARPGGDAARVRLFRSDGALQPPAKGLTTVVTRTAPRAGGRPTTIASLATYVPPRLLTNADLEKLVETTDEWILQRTGIRERHIRRPRCRDVGPRRPGGPESDRESGADARRHRHHRRRYGDARHDVSEHRLLDPAQDRRAACVGFRLERGLLRVHLFSHHCQSVCRQRRARSRAGGRRRRDVEHHRLQGSSDLRAVRRWCRRLRRFRPAKPGEPHIIDFEHEVDGGGGSALCMPAGGSAKPASHDTVDHRLHYVKQDGQTVFNFAVRKTEEISRRLLDRNGIARQTSTCSFRIRPTAASSVGTEKLGIDPDKVIINIERFGNTTAATIPLALNDAVCAGRLKKGSLVLLASVGAGFTVGSVLLRWGF
jgi:3-oxoacyl-[acyl-carrier-protein] synthase-3